MTKTILLILTSVATAVQAQVVQPATSSLDSLLKPVKWRSIGPFRGGRSNAATGVVGE
jgi:hypothetical protein